MEINLLLHVVLFIVYLFPQAMFINGAYLAAAGRSEIGPDGRVKDLSEMIFYPIRKYLEQHTKKAIYFSGEQLRLLLEEIFNTYPALSLSGVVELSQDDMIMWGKLKKNIENQFDLKIEFRYEKEIVFYREYTEYRFSKWLRKPTFGCIICMASFWGVFTFLIPAGFIFKFNAIVLLLYIPNTFCLSFLNYKLNKPL